MTIRDCMTTDVQTVGPDDDIATVRERLRRRHIRPSDAASPGGH